MKTPKEQKQFVVGKGKQNPKELKNSACCGPTCCSSSNKKETSRKEQ
jgi:hypothetical protein